MGRIVRAASIVLAIASLAPGVAAQERDAIPVSYTWDLTDLYASDAAWGTAKDALIQDLAQIERKRGTLGASPQALADGLEAWGDLLLRSSRLGAYASMSHDTDQRVGRTQQMRQQAVEVGTRLGAATSWIRPEILAMGSEKVRGYVAAEPRLAAWRQPLEDIVRRAPHTLSPEAEKLVAQASALTDAGQSIRDIFVNAEFPYPEVVLSNGERVRVDAAAYTLHRASTNREDRKKVFEAFWGSYSQYTRTLATALDAQVRAHAFRKEVRGFDSTLAASLFADNIPTEVYRRLIADVHRNLPTLHRYLGIRKRMMGLPDLGYEDLYAPIVGSLQRTFSPEEAIDLTLRAVEPLGGEYRDGLARGFQDRWVDWFPSTGKRSGAYSTAVFGVHPYQLQNFTGLYDEVSTLAHEAGHSMHSYLAMKTQPFPTADYPIFMAEVASTLNENLLFRLAMQDARDDDSRLVLLGGYLDNLRTTLFRQTLFAEFELAIHEEVEQGRPLTAEGLNAAYLALLRKYYGHAEGVCRIADAYQFEWAYIPHLYYDYYVYQYATSVVAATSLAEGILTEARGGAAARPKRDAYIAMLSAGSSRYAHDLLRDAGVDLATSAPFDAAMREMNRIMDEIEAILARRR